MLNDRDKKYDEEQQQEESEYHFSDEEVNYEVETDSAKPVVASEQKENIFNRLSRSKRMLISGGVFLVLVFVVYKMVTPGTETPPSTDIVPSSPVVQQPVLAKRPAQEAVKLPPQSPIAAPVTQTVSAAPATPTPPLTQQPIQPVSASQQPAQMAPIQQVAALPQVVTAPGPGVTQQPLPQQQMAQQQIAQPTTPPSSAIAAQQQAPPPGMPAVIPVQSAVPTTQPTVAGLNLQTPSSVDTKMTVMASENEKLISQLQSEYSQKISDYATQNKEMQDQLQTLNTRIASMETQMNQLIQTLTRQTQGAPAAPPSIPDELQAPEQKIPYNVQAIIPGRAWLRSDSGETLTVAEGDVIKDVGRVTKIDPYDGVVEINTGNKVVSLTYGTSG